MTTPLSRAQIAGTRWEPDQYLKFSDHRLRPALELLGRIQLDSPAVIYDLGCGAGQLTRILADQWPSATVYGLDNSAEMLAQAAKEPSRVRWLEADIRSWQPQEPPDLIYSNATLQWVPESHDVLLPRLLAFLKPRGCLAAQMPLSWVQPAHRLMRETLADGGRGGSPLGTERLRQTMAQDWVGSAESYYDLCAGRTSSLDIWETEYLQILEGHDPVLEWVKGTALRPILKDLDGDERARFLDEYTRRLRAAYPVRADGRTLYPFRRLFIVGTV
jgi:trans-aconitate 2-methyltransferase